MEMHQPDNWTLDFAALPPARAELGESPVWSPAENCLWWVDITGKRLFRTDAASGETHIWPTPEEAGCVVPMAGGGVAVGMETGLYRFDSPSEQFSLVCALGEPGIRFNDAATDSAGRLWAGTMDIHNRSPIGKLVRIDPDGTLTVMQTGLRTPNGLALDALGGRLYFSDSHADIQTIWTRLFDPATGGLGPRRVFARTDDLKGRPDGACLDEDGNYWIAAVGGGVIHVFAPDATRLAEIPTPTLDPTKPAFAGPDLGVLYLTSKTGPDGGGILVRAATDFRGRAQTPFG